MRRCRLRRRRNSGQTYEPFQYRTLLQVSAALGVPYAYLSNDMLKANYSNSRLALLEFRRRIEAYQHAVIVWQLCRQVWARWMDTAVLAGALDLPGYDQRRREYLACGWLPPKWDWVDPLKDARAEIEQIDAGLKSRTQALAERGYDAEQVDAEIAADKAREKSLGLTFGSIAPADAAAERPGRCIQRQLKRLKMLNLPHVASRVFGTPLMIARAKLEVILGVLGPRLAGGALEVVDPEADPAPLTSITAEKIAVVSVIGTLVSRSGYLDAASGLQAYGDIADAIAAAMDDASVRGVILDVDSPGGEVGGLFDLVEQIQAIRSASAKPLWAVANESALSAAYAIASTADRLYVTRTGEVGSIGVVAVHVDESGADAKAGLAWTFVFAGERKVDGNAHEPLSRTRPRNDPGRC